MFVAVTVDPDWVSVAFQICETVCEPGHEKITVQPLIGTEPVLVTVIVSWKPPLHELVVDQVAAQLATPEALAEGEAEADADGEAEAEAEALGDADGLGEALALGEAECDGVADGEVEGCVPVPLVSTTTDSAGILSDVPENVLCVTVGLAALYAYSVSDRLLMPRLDVLIVYALDGSALASSTA